MATPQARTRTPEGTPAGGQFAQETGSRPSGSLTAPADPATGVSFAELAKDDRVEAMRAEIDRAMDELSDPQAWKRFLDYRSTFHHYSLNNQMLIMIQKPDATQIAGFQTWKKTHERSVKPGEKAIWILAPKTFTKVETNAATGEETKRVGIGGFRSVGVFDVSQTEGKDVPANPSGDGVVKLDGQAPEGMAGELTSFVESAGFTVSYDDTGDADGYTDFAGKRVVIGAGFSPRHQARVLAHEAAHIALNHGAEDRKYHTGRGGERDAMEVEADSTAYVIGRAYGMDDIGDTTFAYIDGWAHGDRDKVRKTAANVCAATKTVLTELDAIRNQKAAA
jgi:hypothetical protein